MNQPPSSLFRAILTLATNKINELFDVSINFDISINKFVDHSRTPQCFDVKVKPTASFVFLSDEASGAWATPSVAMTTIFR